MSVNLELTTAMPIQYVLTMPVRLNVLASMAIQKLAINALTLMNARQRLTAVINRRSAQTLVGHFSVNAMEGILEMEQPVQISMNAFRQSTATSMRIVQIHRDRLCVHAKQDFPVMAEAVKVR